MRLISRAHGPDLEPEPEPELGPDAPPEPEPEAAGDELEDPETDQPNPEQPAVDIPPPEIVPPVDGISGASRRSWEHIRRPAVTIPKKQPPVRGAVQEAHRRARKYVGRLGGAPRGVALGALVVVQGQHDHMENILRLYRLPFTLVTQARLATRSRLHPGQILFVNCGQTEPKLRRRLAKKVRRFVEAGGWLMTTDWAIEPYITEGFPRKVKLLSVQQW
ncbi:MAG: hypothetical protein ACE5JG_08165, partial [Planctomycetota bacterium]